jgi:hypothetical protein
MDRHIAQRSVGLAVMKRSGIKRSCDFGQSVTSQGADITPDSQATIHDAREAQRVGKGLSATDVLILLRALGKDKGVIDGGRRYKGGGDVDDGIRTVSVEGQLAAKQSNVETVKRSCRARKGDLCSTP